jgi:hypothetical protein
VGFGACAAGVGACAASAWIALSSTAWGASRQDAKEAPAVKEYVLPWTLVILCAALGLITVCRPGKRSEKARVKVEE